jgi:hypothetical protein
VQIFTSVTRRDGLQALLAAHFDPTKEILAEQIRQEAED